MGRIKVVIACVLLTGCGGGSLPNQQPATAPPASAAWIRVSETTTCEALQPSFCVGRYGYTVNSAGVFIVGPSNDGQKLTGQITADELAALSGDATLVGQGNPGPPEVCDSQSGTPGVSDTVIIDLPAQSGIKIYERSLTGACTEGGADAARNLQARLHGLMVKYYPTPFPTSSAAVRNGRWGGKDAQLDVSDSNSFLQLDCGHGNIPGRLELNSSGQFDQMGTLTPEFGPEPIGGRPSHPVEYSGSVSGSGDAMQLTITDNSGSTVSTSQFNLVFGKNGQLLRCQ